MKPGSTVYEFDRAIVREPARSVVHGLRALDRGEPDVDKLRAEHTAYVCALEAAGVSVTVLATEESFPDSVFVEDPALVFSNGAIELRPGAATRLGEAALLRPTLEMHFDQVLSLAPTSCAEGGDVLVTPDAVLIGLSDRTSAAGAQSVIECLSHLGLRGRVVQTPPGVLHFKTDCSLLDAQTVLATARLAASSAFDGFEIVLTPEGEEAAANALRVNDVVFVGSHFERTIEVLDRRGYQVVALDTSEIGKVDAGLSCMSLRWKSQR
ncbi:MAG: dimethylarginine dimethylaminohydrolase family protein [Gammaproteobacteria bacterium]